MIRTATPEDLSLVRALWRAFDDEIPDAEWREDDSADDLAALEERIGTDLVLLADDAGLLVASKKGERVGFVDMLYVRPEARGTGVAADLMREAAARLREQGAETVELEVLASNGGARAVYEKWGFKPVELTLAAPVDRLVQALDTTTRGPTFGSIHVQTDDSSAVERAVQKALPRFGRSAGTTIGEPKNGWVAVHDELSDREPSVLQRLAKELSYASGGVVLALGIEEGALVRYTLYDRGGAVDEYASVPEYRGALPPGDVIALGANPTVVSRLTGADPGRVRAVARTAAAPADLPPALELLEQLADVMGVSDATHGWES